MNIEIQKKPQTDYLKNIKIVGTEDVIRLSEVQEIKDAVQEHLLFIGLDRGNNIRTISLIGIGTTSGISINRKDVLRTALLTASDRVILVHNHTSNTLKASHEDKNLTNIINKFLNIFNIQLLDHVIVTENGYLSMLKENLIDINYENNDIRFIENTLLIEENDRLKKEIDDLNYKLEKEKKIFEQDSELEF